MNTISLFKALGDSSRLAILKELRKGPRCSEELSEILRLVPSTISHHAGKLVDAGLVTISRDQQIVFYSLENSILQKTIAELIEKSDQTNNKDGRKEAYRNKVLSNFIELGRLKTIPAQRRKRRIILEQIVGELDEDRKYTEKELNNILLKWHEDYCFLRREMISENLLNREAGIYWKI